MCVGVAKVPRTPGGHEEQEGGGAGGVTVPLLQGAALLPAQVTAGNQIPEEGQRKQIKTGSGFVFPGYTGTTGITVGEEEADGGGKEGEQGEFLISCKLIIVLYESVSRHTDLNTSCSMTSSQKRPIRVLNRARDTVPS